jgi:hypothetical protein
MPTEDQIHAPKLGMDVTLHCAAHLQRRSLGLLSVFVSAREATDAAYQNGSDDAMRGPSMAPLALPLGSHIYGPRTVVPCTIFQDQRLQPSMPERAD